MRYTATARMKVEAKLIANSIIAQYKNERGAWLDDAILNVIIKIYNLDELTALECLEGVKSKVKMYIYAHMENCKRRSIPPSIKLIDDEIAGRQRPENMDLLSTHIRNVKPFDFQKLCCIYIKESHGYTVLESRRRNGGADIVAKTETSLYIIAQARTHKTKSVDKKELDNWLLKVGKNFPGAAKIFLTSTSYSRSAEEYAEKNFIKLVDGEQIAYFLATKGVTPNNLQEFIKESCEKCTVVKCEIK